MLNLKNLSYVIGIVGTEIAATPTKIIDACTKFNNYLNKYLNVNSQIKVMPDSNTLINELKNGSIQLGFVTNPVDYINIKKQVNITPIVKPKKDGESTYKSYILVRKDSGINNLNDLKGKTFAYCDKCSLSGYIFPDLLIKSKLKISIESFFSKFYKTPKAYDSILAVYYKQADATAVSDLTYDASYTIQPRLKIALKTIEVSEPYEYGPFFHNNVKDHSRLERFKNELINMENNLEANQILMLLRISGYTPAKDSDYHKIRALLNKK